MTKSTILSVSCFLFNVMTTFAAPPYEAYNYANKAVRGGSPVEDHSQHLAYVAAAYQQTDQNYNNFLDLSTLQKIPYHQTGPVQEHAAYEIEHPDSAIRTKYENAHKFVGNIKKSRALIDNIQEHEKYGNSGDKLAFVFRGFVDGQQKLADLINGIIEGSGVKFTGVTTGIAAELDKLGAKIVGL